MSFRVLVDVIPGTRLDQTQTIIADIEQALLREEAVTNISTRIGYEQGARYLGGRGAMDTHQAEISVDLNAVATRFRPVMMTALSTVAGMLPLALELAVGSERFSPIATVIIGGILASTLLTLVIIPVLLKALPIKTTGR
nr:efflux RND transporter permease subunit [Pelovirga terrestris]